MKLQIRLGFLGVIGLAAWGCQPTGVAPGTAPGATVERSSTAKVVRQDLVGYAFFSGKVVTPMNTQVVVTSPYDLPVEEVLTSIGKRVGRGETIIKMAIPGQAVTVESAKANLASAEAALAAARAENEGPVRNAQKALAEARAAEKAARVGVQAGGSDDLTSATQARIAAEEALRAAKADVDSRLTAERQAVAAAAEYYRDARAGIKQSIIRAPISGTVIALEAKPGMQTKARQPLATIIDYRSITIQGIVPPERADEVKRDTNILIAMEGQNSDPFMGKVREVSVLPPAAGQKSAGYLAVITFDNDKGVVQPNSVVRRLGVRTGKVENALVVPVDAVTKDSNGKWVVQVQKGSEWVSTFVEPGISDGALIEIKSGLEEGQVVKVVAPAVAPAPESGAGSAK